MIYILPAAPGLSSTFLLIIKRISERLSLPQSISIFICIFGFQVVSGLDLVAAQGAERAVPEYATVKCNAPDLVDFVKKKVDNFRKSDLKLLMNLSKGLGKCEFNTWSKQVVYRDFWSNKIVGYLDTKVSFRVGTNQKFENFVCVTRNNSTTSVKFCLVGNKYTVVTDK